MTRRQAFFFLMAAVAAVGFLLPASAKAEKFRPISTNWEVAAPGANTDAITDIAWNTDYGLRLVIQADTSTVVNLMVNDGSNENALGMNSNTALVAGATYIFDVYGLPASSTVNVQVESDSALPICSIGEIRLK